MGPVLNLTRKSLHEIQTDAGEILGTDLFQEAANTDHHYGYTIANHEIHVCIIALLIVAALTFLGIHFHVRELVRGIMCHDLGLVGRYDGRFHSGRDCAFRHPLESEKEAEKICSHLTPIETDVITKHMFPLCKTGIPSYRETWVITIADKWCAVTEGLHLSRRNWINEKGKQNG